MSVLFTSPTSIKKYVQVCSFLGWQWALCDGGGEEEGRRNWESVGVGWLWHAILETAFSCFLPTFSSSTVVLQNFGTMLLLVWSQKYAWPICKSILEHPSDPEFMGGVCFQCAVCVYGMTEAGPFPPSTDFGCDILIGKSSQFLS